MEALGQLLIPVIIYSLLLLVTIIDLLVRKDMSTKSKLGWFVVSLVPIIGSLIYAASTRRRFILVCAVLAVIGLITFYGAKYYMTHKPARDVTKEQGIGITADSLYKAYATNETMADSLYTNKAIQVTGEVLKVSKDDNNQTSVELKTSDSSVTVNCKFKTDPGEIKAGNSITFKGICTGFLMVSIPIIEGVIIKK
jgi:hypothetical protein